VTFWTQLRQSTPLLSYRTEEELECRYRKILQDQGARENKDMDGNSSTSRSRIRSKSKAYSCGSSPELLTNWWMEEHSSSSGINPSAGAMMMGGELLNGSRIWFPLSQTGTLAGSTRPSWSHVIYSDAASSTSPPCRGRRQISILICFLPSRLVATSTSLLGMPAV